jgi:hypothetical protein
VKVSVALGSTYLRGDAERDLDEVAQIGIAIGAADLAEVMSRGGGERRQALDDLTAAGADVLPFHREQAELPRVKEELDHCGGREPASLPEADGVDAHKRVVTRGSHEYVERLEQISSARNRSGESLQPLREELLIHNWHVEDGVATRRARVPA